MLTSQHIISMFVFAAAGFCLFLPLLNRMLSFLRDSRYKNPLILGSFAVLCGGGLVLGYFLHGSMWIAIPGVILLVAAINETRRLIQYHHYKSTEPNHNDGPSLNLSKPITTTNLRFLHYEVPHPKWHGPRLRIVHISDIHVTSDLPLNYYTQAMDKVAQLEPDITVHTGDFLTDADALPLLEQVLRPIGRYGDFASLGNHDYWAGAEAIRHVIHESSITLVENTSTEVTLGEQTFTLSATDARWGKQPIDNLATPESQLHLVLSHTADNIYELTTHNADFVFSGHYHGGQFRIPWIGPIVIPSIYGRRFDRGHFVVQDTHLFISGGLGSASPPLRIYCPPDILVIDIIPESVN